jgi:hypothetical protein
VSFHQLRRLERVCHPPTYSLGTKVGSAADVAIASIGVRKCATTVTDLIIDAFTRIADKQTLASSLVKMDNPITDHGRRNKCLNNRGNTDRHRLLLFVLHVTTHGIVRELVTA